MSRASREECAAQREKNPTSAHRLPLSYAVAASAVSVGWSGYIVGLLANLPQFYPSLPAIVIPPELAAGPYAGGVINILAVFIALAITCLLVIGTIARILISRPNRT